MTLGSYLACAADRRPPSRCLVAPRRQQRSPFVTDLAYESAELESAAKIGIVAASIMASVLGAVVLLRRTKVPDDVSQT